MHTRPYCSLIYANPNNPESVVSSRSAQNAENILIFIINSHHQQRCPRPRPPPPHPHPVIVFIKTRWPSLRQKELMTNSSSQKLLTQRRPGSPSWHLW